MKHSFGILFISVFLVSCAGSYNHPTLSGDPSRMSADTLCYRAAYARDNPAVTVEIAARNLDCRDILEQMDESGY